MANTIGIDFGTTKTLVAYMDERLGRSCTVRLGRGTDHIPTSVYVLPGGGMLFGDDAEDMVEDDATRYCRSFKLRLGEPEPSRVLFIPAERKTYSARELTAAFLRYVRERCEAEVFMGGKVAKAVITCPVLFSPAQREDLKLAAEKAGFSHVELALEPEAAGYAFCHLCPQEAFSGNALIVDWGGGTLDLALVSREGERVEVHNAYTAGDSQMGGEIFDHILFSHVSEQIKNSRGVDLRQENPAVLPLLLRRTRELKERLSKQESRALLLSGSQGVFPVTVSRKEFERLIAPGVVKASTLTRRLISSIPRPEERPELLLLVGGTSAIPCIASELERVSDLPCYKWQYSREAVALGAALLADRMPATGSAASSRRDVPSGGRILGIDLGTTNSCMAIMGNGRAVVLENSEGKRTTPSVVAFTKEGKVLVGQAAKNQIGINPGNTICGAKKFLGLKFADLQAKEVDGYNIVVGPDGGVRFQVDMVGGKKEFSPQEICARLLSKLKADAEAKLGETISETVISIPSYFTSAQRDATKEAAKLAGLRVRRLVCDPLAAALAYGVDKGGRGRVVVCNLGGSSLEAALIEISDDVVEVQAYAHCGEGGRDIDRHIAERIGRDFCSREGIDLSRQPVAWQRILEEAEKAKMVLGSVQNYDVSLPFITMDATGPKHLLTTITRPLLKQYVQGVCDRAFGIVRNTITSIGDSLESIEKVVLVGGGARMPAVLEELGCLVGQRMYTGLNADEAVAIGTAIQGGIFSGSVQDAIVLDVTPHTYALEMAGGVATPVIERNTTIPIRKSLVFSTSADNQDSVSIRVCEGENKMFNDNSLCCDFVLGGIKPAPRGVHQIMVTFDIDSNGNLTVSAEEKEREQEHGVSTASSCDIIRYAQQGATDQVRRCLEEGADVNCTDADGWTPLMWAALEGHAGTAELLLEHGANLEYKTDSLGIDAIRLAADRGHHEVVDVLSRYASSHGNGTRT